VCRAVVFDPHEDQGVGVWLDILERVAKLHFLAGHNLFVVVHELVPMAMRRAAHFTADVWVFEAGEVAVKFGVLIPPHHDDATQRSGRAGRVAFHHQRGAAGRLPRVRSTLALASIWKKLLRSLFSLVSQ